MMFFWDEGSILLEPIVDILTHQEDLLYALWTWFDDSSLSSSCYNLKRSILTQDNLQKKGVLC